MAATGSSGPSGRRTAGGSFTWCGTTPLALRCRGLDAPSPTSGPSTRTGRGNGRSSTAHSSRVGRPTVRSSSSSGIDANPDRATLGVYVASSDGTGVRQLVRAPLWGSERVPPAWSPTGRTIVYGVGMGAVRLHLLNVDGRRARFLAVGSSPAWSHDGGRIAFTRSSGIWVIPSRGGRPRRVAAASALHGLPFPAWSPAGTQLAYNSGNQLYVARIDGRSTKPVAQGATCTCVGCCRVSPPVWSRNGRRLYYWS